jgi:DNA polymerase
MIVQDIGPRDAKVMLVGEAPGEEEERTGRPFEGASGKLLKHMCSHAGILFQECYVTNVMGTRPPGNDFKMFYEGGKGKVPTPALEKGRDTLRAKIEAIKPKVVIALGNEPLKAICNKSGISDWRGTWLRYRDSSVLPTYHPSYILRQYGDHPIVEMDLAKAVRCTPKAYPAIIVNPSLSEVLNWIDTARRGKIAAFDIEALGGRIRTLGFASPVTTHRAISIPFVRMRSGSNAGIVAGRPGIVSVGQFGDTPGSYWSAEDELRVLDAIDSFFRSDILFYSQNGLSFDEPFLHREFGLSIAHHYFDTMHGWHCLYAEFPKGLDFLCSVLTDYPNYWTEHDASDDRSDQFYNGMDCVVTLEAGVQIERELKEALV